MKEHSPLVYKKDTPPSSAKHQDVSVAVKQPRSSNLELYRIICMLMIVAHHFVVNSGLSRLNGQLLTDYTSLNSYFLCVFGAWGKTGINCFIMITGYYMCASKITIRKYLKLLLQIYFYQFSIYFILLIGGYESLSTLRLVKLCLPFWGFTNGFSACFVIFYLTIPFWSVLVQNIGRKEHLLLLVLLLSCYSLLGSIPTFHVSFNYITWFGIIFLIASYIRMYPGKLFDKKGLWGWITFVSVLCAISSIVFLRLLLREKVGIGYHFISDSNKIFAIIVAVSSFLWFKNMKIKYSKLINAFGAATYGTLLIHANSDAMRTWLWKDTIDVVGHYSLPLGQLIFFSIGTVLTVFVVCNLIDQIRIATIEKWFFKIYDSKLSVAVDQFVKRVTID